MGVGKQAGKRRTLVDVDNTGFEAQKGGFPGPLKSQRIVTCSWLCKPLPWCHPGICHQLGPLGCGGALMGRAGSTGERQGLPGGCRGFADMKDGQSDQDRREESGQVGPGHALTSQLWPGDLLRASNSR